MNKKTILVIVSVLIITIIYFGVKLLKTNKEELGNSEAEILQTYKSKLAESSFIDVISNPEIIKIIDFETNRFIGILDSDKVTYMNFRRDNNTFKLTNFLNPNSENVNTVEHIDGKSYWIFGVNDSNQVATAKLFANKQEYNIYPEVSKRGFYVTDITAAHTLTQDGTIQYEYEFLDKENQLIWKFPK